MTSRIGLSLKNERLCSKGKSMLETDLKSLVYRFGEKNMKKFSILFFVIGIMYSIQGISKNMEPHSKINFPKLKRNHSAPALVAAPSLRA